MAKIVPTKCDPWNGFPSSQIKNWSNKSFFLFFVFCFFCFFCFAKKISSSAYIKCIVHVEKGEKETYKGFHPQYIKDYFHIILTLKWVDVSISVIDFVATHVYIPLWDVSAHKTCDINGKKLSVLLLTQ